MAKRARTSPCRCFFLDFVLDTTPFVLSALMARSGCGVAACTQSYSRVLNEFSTSLLEELSSPTAYKQRKLGIAMDLPSFDLPTASEQSSPLVFRSTSTNPYHNLAIEDYLLRTSAHTSHILFFYTNRPCVVLGRNQNPWLECDLRSIRDGLHLAEGQDGGTRLPIDLVRRRSGGGTVFHGDGNLNYAVIVPNDVSFKRAKHAQMVVEALKKITEYDFKAEIRVNERNDIVMQRDGQTDWLKISGSAFKLIRGRALHHGTLLYSSPSLSSISELLRSPGRGLIHAKGVESVRSKVGNLMWMADSQQRDMLRDSITRAIMQQFHAMYGQGSDLIEVGDQDVVGEDNVGIRHGANEMATNEWRFGQTPKFEFQSGLVEWNGRRDELTFNSNRGGAVEQLSLRHGDGRDPTETKPEAAAEPSENSEPEDSDTRPPPASTDTSVYDDTTGPLPSPVKHATATDDPTKRLDDMIRDRDDLRAQVSHLRQSLEQLQARHSDEIEDIRAKHHIQLEHVEAQHKAAIEDVQAQHKAAIEDVETQHKAAIEDVQAQHKAAIEDVQAQLQESQGEKEHAEEQYQNLLGKVNTIRSQLGERLKADADELAQARTRIEELEEEKTDLQEQHTLHAREIEELRAKMQDQATELSSLRSRTNLAQQNWTREKEELIESEAYMREEFENAKQSMRDWELLATEERAIRRDLADRVADLEEQVASSKESYESVKAERDSQLAVIEGLQINLQEVQAVRRTELKELAEKSKAEADALQAQLEDAQAKCDSLSTELAEANKERERLSPFEKEVKEKQLLIGKLKHEAVILNDHLTKALRFLKKGKADDNVDRYLLQFLALDRSDPKKFQVLQLIAALLGWTEEQKEKAGLARPGAATRTAPTPFGSLRGLASPNIHRTPSTPSLTKDYFPDAGSPASKETLAELWQNFLEQEASAPSPLSPKGLAICLATMSAFPGMSGPIGGQNGQTAGLSEQEQQMVKMMQAGMESCLTKSILSGGAGFVLGGAFGLFMASMAYDTPLSAGMPGAPGSTTASLPWRQQLKLGLKDMGMRSWSSAKNFGMIGALYSGTECCVEGLRAKNDLTNSVVAGCLTGGALGIRAGPSATALGCAGFAAFSTAIDAYMRMPSD
ncbi:hypothetical protein DV735_g4988, partial [Chaetothyriales sp. CBS 134920]